MAAEATKLDTAVRNADYDALAAQLATLRQDFMTLAASAGGAVEGAATAAGKKARAVSGDIADAVGTAATKVLETERAAQSRVEAAIQANPLVAVGVASLVGYLLGALTRR